MQRIWATGIIIGLAILDIVTKYVAFALIQDRFSIGPLFFTKAFNKGFSFGLLPQGAIIYTILAFLATAIIIWQLPKAKHPITIGLTLIAGGALGNGIDRLLHGAVRDFIGITHFAIFNFADMFISAGACIILFIEVKNWLQNSSNDSKLSK